MPTTHGNKVQAGMSSNDTADGLDTPVSETKRSLDDLSKEELLRFIRKQLPQCTNIHIHTYTYTLLSTSRSAYTE